MSDKEELSELKRKVAALEAKINEAEKVAESDFVPLTNEEHFDQMHQARERAANNFRFSPEIQRKMNEACGTEDLRDLVHASRAPKGPDYQGVIPSSQTVVGGHWAGRGIPSTTPGWREATPLSNPPGIAQADKIADEFARRDREELKQKLGRR